MKVVTVVVLSTYQKVVVPAELDKSIYKSVSTVLVVIERTTPFGGDETPHSKFDQADPPGLNAMTLPVSGSSSGTFLQYKKSFEIVAAVVRAAQANNNPQRSDLINCHCRLDD